VQRKSKFFEYLGIETMVSMLPKRLKREKGVADNEERLEEEQNNKEGQRTHHEE